MLKLRSRGHVTQLIFFSYSDKIFVTQKNVFLLLFFFLFQSLNVGLQPSFLICNTFFCFLFVCLSVCFFSTQAIFLQFFCQFLVFISSIFATQVFLFQMWFFLFWFKALKVILLMIFFYFLILLYIDFALFISVCISVFFAVHFFSVSHFFCVFFTATQLFPTSLMRFCYHLLFAICLLATFFRPLVVM